MPIRFHCKRCHQLLGIASRKAGSEIQCPKCGISQIVPNEEAASAALAMDQFAKTQGAAEGNSSLTVYDDEPAAIETPGPRGPEEPALTMPAWAASAPRAQGEPGGPVAPGMILYPRRTLYLQGVLLVALFAVGLGSGYLIGRGTSDQGEADSHKVLIEGTLLYDPGTGQPAGDQDAVIIALPKGKPPKRKISFDTFRPRVTATEIPEGVRRIRELGGEYALADASGGFSIKVPFRSEYYLLLVSNHAIRPDGTDIDEVDLVEIAQYLNEPSFLIGRYQYRWISQPVGRIKIDHQFGRDGQ